MVGRVKVSSVNLVRHEISRKVCAWMRRRIGVVARIIKRWWRRYLKGPASDKGFPRLRQRIALVASDVETSRDWRVELSGAQGLRVEYLFVHIPKNGGISFRDTLGNNLGFVEFPGLGTLSELEQPRRWVLNHSDPERVFLKNFLPADEVLGAEVFTVVRNPYSRAISLYRYLQRRKMFPAEWSFERFLRHVQKEDPIPGLAKVIRLSQAAPQVRWVKPLKRLEKFRLFKLEELNVFEAYAQERFTESVKIPWHNRDPGSTKPKELSPIETALIQEIYYEDFEQLGYTMALPSQSL